MCSAEHCLGVTITCTCLTCLYLADMLGAGGQIRKPSNYSQDEERCCEAYCDQDYYDGQVDTENKYN